eukprot:351986-Chlamydomonas_euryale.AAC.1
MPHRPSAAPGAVDATPTCRSPRHCGRHTDLPQPQAMRTPHRPAAAPGAVDVTHCTRAPTPMAYDRAHGARGAAPLKEVCRCGQRPVACWATLGVGGGCAKRRFAVHTSEAPGCVGHAFCTYTIFNGLWQAGSAWNPVGP